MRYTLHAEAHSCRRHHRSLLRFAVGAYDQKEGRIFGCQFVRCERIDSCLPRHIQFRERSTRSFQPCLNRSKDHPGYQNDQPEDGEDSQPAIAVPPRYVDRIEPENNPNRNHGCDKKDQREGRGASGGRDWDDSSQASSRLPVLRFNLCGLFIHRIGALSDA